MIRRWPWPCETSMPSPKAGAQANRLPTPAAQTAPATRLRPLVGEDHCREGASQHLRQIEDAEIREAAERVVGQ